MDQKTHLKQLVEWFWQNDSNTQKGDPPPATLIVTCRDEKDLGELLDLPYDYSGRPLKNFQIGEFSSSEVEKTIKVVGVNRCVHPFPHTNLS